MGVSSLGSPGPGGPQAETRPSAEAEKPEVELSNLARSSELSQSRSSLRSSSSVGSVRGDEFGLFADFCGDYCPLEEQEERAEQEEREEQQEGSASPGGEESAQAGTPLRTPPSGSHPPLFLHLQVGPGAPPPPRQSRRAGSGWRARAASSWRAGG